MFETILGAVFIIGLFVFTVYRLPKLGYRTRGKKFATAKEKMDWCCENGLPTLPIKPLQKRKYLTLTGIKNWDELTEEDKMMLNIEV